MARRRRRASFWSYAPRVHQPTPKSEALAKRLGRAPQPVHGEGRKLASTFWGRSWCTNLERYHDYANRLPRGRTYLRQGAVLDLDIARGCITALVMGSQLYTQKIEIVPVTASKWTAIRKRCAGQLGSLIELLEGRLSDDVMKAVTEPGAGLFPEPKEIRMTCSCPDWASMCKHLAAVLYGVGLRLDTAPELMFVLRGVSADELVDAGGLVSASVDERRIPAAELSEIFGVRIDDRALAEPESKRERRSEAKRQPQSSVKEKPRINSGRKWITESELLAHGLSRRKIAAWVRDGHLMIVDGHEGYRLLPEARRRLQALV